MFTQLRVLDYFDFWMKLDDDVRWAQPFPGDITHHLITKHHTLVHSGAPATCSTPMLTQKPNQSACPPCRCLKHRCRCRQMPFMGCLCLQRRWAGRRRSGLQASHGTCAGLRQERNLDCIGRERLSASKVARLYLDTESSLCRKVLAARGSHHAWFDNDTEVISAAQNPSICVFRRAASMQSPALSSRGLH